MRRRRGGLLAVAVVVGGCAGSGPASEAGDGPTPLTSAAGSTSGKQLFHAETFDGNGRTCATCHTVGANVATSSGALSIEDVQRRYAANPNDPLFRRADSDDPTAATPTYNRLLTYATVRVSIPLPRNVRIVDPVTGKDLGYDSITVYRGVPSVMNVGGQEATDQRNPLYNRGVFQWDGHVPDLQTQARNAIMGHAEAPLAPSSEATAAIAAYERESLNTSSALRAYAENPDDPSYFPELPAGRTAAERRGRRFFEPTGVCGQCHSGPMLNEVSPHTNSQIAHELPPPRQRFTNIFTGIFELFGNAHAGATASVPVVGAGGLTRCRLTPSTGAPSYGPRIECEEGNQVLSAEANTGVPLRSPLYRFRIEDPPGSGRFITDYSSDPGHLLATGRYRDFERFKMPSLWNVKNTAPYFHNNSAQTLEDVLDHYSMIFTISDADDAALTFSPQDRADMLAYMQLL